MAFYEVLRPFNALGRVLSIGERVSDDGWQPRRAKSLIESRYLKALFTYNGEIIEPSNEPPRKRKGQNA